MIIPPAEWQFLELAVCATAIVATMIWKCCGDQDLLFRKDLHRVLLWERPALSPPDSAHGPQRAALARNDQWRQDELCMSST